MVEMILYFLNFEEKCFSCRFRQKSLGVFVLSFLFDLSAEMLTEFLGTLCDELLVVVGASSSILIESGWKLMPKMVQISVADYERMQPSSVRR